MKQITIYTSAEYKALSNKKQAYEPWNNLTVSELLNVYSNVYRQLQFKFESPYNIRRANKNSAFKGKFDQLCESINTMSELNEQIRTDVSEFYEYLKYEKENDSSERNREIDTGDRETQQPTNIDSVVQNLLNRVEFLQAQVDAAKADNENKDDADFPPF